MSGFSIGGFFKSLINPATLMQLAMGPAGWASIAAKAILSAVVQQVIQKLGQELGLPPAIISMAQQAAGSAMGTGDFKSSIEETVSQLAQDRGLSAVEQGFMGRSAQDAYRKLVASIMESEDFKAARSGAKGKTGAAANSAVSSGDSWLMQIATILGQMADKKLGEAAALARTIGGTKDGEQQNKVSELTGQMQAKMQEFSLVSNAMTNVVKSLGEGLSTIARKG
jgi:hypothetical protein